MKNSKLIKVLRTLNKSEFKQFGKFVYSPYFSNGRNVIPLFDILKKFYPNFDSEGFNRDNILGELSRNGYKATNQHLKTQMSEMYKLTEKFLTIQSGGSETGLNTFFFARNCRKRGLYRLGESKILDSIDKIKKNRIDGSFYHNYYFGKAELINFFFMKDQPLKGVQMLSHLSEVLLHQFLCNVSRYFYNMIALGRGMNVRVENNLMLSFLNMIKYEELLKKLERKNDVFSTASRIYIFFILMFLKSSDNAYYFRLKKELFNNIFVFSFYDQSFLLQAINFRAADLIKGLDYELFAKETFEVINFRLDNNLYKQDPSSHYTANEFHSAFNIGFILRKKEWIQDFVKKHLKEVPLEQRDTCYNIGKPFLEFLEYDYIKCLKSINHLKNLPIPLAFSLKRLQLMAYYEVGHIVEAFYAIDAFKNFLRQNKNVTSEFMERNLDFVKFYSNLLKHKCGEKELNIKKILLESKKSAAENQEWLVEKIEKMILSK